MICFCVLLVIFIDETPFESPLKLSERSLDSANTFFTFADRCSRRNCLSLLSNMSCSMSWRRSFVFLALKAANDSESLAPRDSYFVHLDKESLAAADELETSDTTWKIFNYEPNLLLNLSILPSQCVSYKLKMLKYHFLHNCRHRYYSIISLRLECDPRFVRPLKWWKIS